MWGSLLSALLSDIPSSFQYSIGQPVEAQPAVGGLYKLSIASHKSNKHDQVSAFVFERKTAIPGGIDEAQRILKMARSLRHPFILNVKDVLETGSGNLYIVTEQAEPLSTYLNKSENNRHVAREMIVWNLKCISEALEFLHEANIIHRGICLETIFVTSECQWKLGIPEMGWDLSTGSPQHISVSANPLKIIYESGNPYSIQPIPVPINTPATDRFMLGCLLSVFWTLCLERKMAGKVVSASSTFPSISGVKWNIGSNKSWKNSKLEFYIRALTDHSEAQADGSRLWENNELVAVMTFFQNYALQNSWDLEKFFEATFPKAVENTKDPRVCALVYLPKLSKILTPGEDEKITPIPARIRTQALRTYSKLLKDCALLSKELFDELGWRTLDQLYHDPERATRFMLLSSIESYAFHLDANQIQKIFEEVLAGLLDSSQELRDVTLRGITVLLPKLIEANCSASVEKALKVITGLILTDKIPGIRTNAAVCLSKVALLVKPRHVLNSIGPGLKSAINDPFSPCKLAGLEGLRKVLPLLSHADLAGQYLPAVSPRLIDDDMQCRFAAHMFAEEALRILKMDLDTNLGRIPPPPPRPIAQSAPQATLDDLSEISSTPAYDEIVTATPKAASVQTPDVESSVAMSTRRLIQKPQQSAQPDQLKPPVLIPNVLPRDHSREGSREAVGEVPKECYKERSVVKEEALSRQSDLPSTRRSTLERGSVTDPSDKFWQEVNCNDQQQPSVKKSLARRTHVHRS